MAIDLVGLDIRINLGDSRLSRSNYSTVLVGPTLLTFIQYSVVICSRLEAANDVISSRFVRLIVPDNFVKFCDPRLNCSLEIRPKVLVFDRFFWITSTRKYLVTAYKI